MRSLRPRIVGTLAHLVPAAVAYWLALAFVSGFALEGGARVLLWQTLPLVLGLRATALLASRAAEGLWRYTDIADLARILAATAMSSVAFAAVALPVWDDLPPAVVALDWLLATALIGGGRLAIRALHDRPSGEARRPVVVVGAGDAGEMLIREIRRNPGLDFEVVALVDDDAAKWGRRIHGVQVRGSIDQLPDVARASGAQEVLIAIPTASDEQRRRLVERARATGLPLKSVPPLGEIVAGHGIANLRTVAPEDLLGRPAVAIDAARVGAQLRGARVLVTGAGGSIGAELCRQIARFEPEALVLVERAESALYFVHHELRLDHPRLNAVPVVADVLDASRVGEVFAVHAPDVVYHAAAYKHVPLMEEHPIEAIRNNVFATEVVATAARGRARAFVLVSTDKAVRPVGVMGMTKRVAEDLIRSLDGRGTRYVAVRFGNVLGSEGSVLPLFQWQLSRGGPVTVTDPEATRYFMLISEAAQLVLQAGAMAGGGEVYFLDMGEPVRIGTLAEDLVRLSGMRPGEDVRIETVGLRPGERLHEELIGETERLEPSEHERILVLREPPREAPALDADLAVLRRLVQANDREGAVTHLKAMATKVSG